MEGEREQIKGLVTGDYPAQDAGKPVGARSKVEGLEDGVSGEENLTQESLLPSFQQPTTC